MPRNFPGRKKHRTRNRLKRSKAALSGGASLEVLLIQELKAAAKGRSITELTAALELPETAMPELASALRNLVQQGRLLTKGRRFLLAPPAEERRATLDVHVRGFAFARLEGEEKGAKDVFIAPHHLHEGSHGDTVLVRIGKSAKGRREGVVTQVLSRAFSTLCGVFSMRNGGGEVCPDDERLPYTVAIAKDDPLAAEAEGVAVQVEILHYGKGRQGPKGRIVAMLGDPWSPSVQIRMAMLQFGLTAEFPQQVLDEAEALEPIRDCEPGREDLRSLAHVTIDGETARDFDDAICVEKTEEGYLLYVSIADVSAYVRPGSAIDREAYQRGVSVYLPDRVLPMLPERLSNHLCSLIPDADRPAFTAVLRFDHQGKRVGERYVKSLIRSRKRCTYAFIDQLVFQQDESLGANHPELAAMMQEASALAALLRQRRIRRGSLEFTIPEIEIEVVKDQVLGMEPARRNAAHLLIEDCMLAANEAVAESLAKAQQPVLYRIHERPDPAKVAAFIDTAKSLGLITTKDANSPHWFATVLAQAAQSPQAYVVNNLLLRAMQQARYWPENLGHFGLAAGFYLHFTSPIRRYPDLVAHRALDAFVRSPQSMRQLDSHAARSPGERLEEMGLYLSQRERRAIEVERNVQARLAVVFMRNKLGHCFEAIISGVSNFGLYVELEASLISGMVTMQQLKDDYYLYDSKRHRLIGERSNRIHQLGAKVQVRLEEANLAVKRLYFSLYTPPGGNTPPQEQGLVK